jgi:hypothetical protein
VKVSLTGVENPAVWRRLLAWLAPVGRMALTNYLMQTVICVFIFYGYGFGQFGRFGALAATLLPLMVLASFDFGVTWDEKPRHHYGELVWEFLRGLRARNTTYVEDGGHLYGGLFDTICAAVERYVPVNRYVLRHAINATFGVGTCIGRLAARFQNGRVLHRRCFTGILPTR